MNFEYSTVYIDGKRRKIGSIINGNSMMNTIEIDGVNSGIGGIFFKDGKVECVKIRSLKDTLNIIRRAVRDDDYDFLLIPRKNNWITQGMYEEYMKEFNDVSIGECLDLIAYIGNWSFKDEEILECYDKIKNTKSDIRVFLNKLSKISDIGIELKIIKAILDKVECIKENKQEKYIMYIKDMIDIRFNHVIYTDLLSEKVEIYRGIENLKDVHEVIEYLSYRGVSDLLNIRGRNKRHYLGYDEGVEGLIYIDRKGNTREIKKKEFTKKLDKKLWNEGFLVKIDLDKDRLMKIDRDTFEV